ncbi:MAG: phospholipase D-like domain-containing protein, partial [Chloroflexota bacterium]
VLNALKQARQSIHLVIYLLLDRPVLAGLAAAERRGVDVRVLMERHPYGGGSGNYSAYTRLRRAGVNVRWTSRRFKLTHEKALVVDNREALILTLNLTASAFSRNREYGVVDRSPVDVAEVEGLFEADWNRSAYRPTAADLVVSPDNSRAKLTSIISQAKRTLDVEAEEVQDKEVEAALLAAARRGVRVRLVISKGSRAHDTNVPGVDRLRAGGVQVHYMNKPFVHAKLVLADGVTAFVGSENISTASLDGNRELGIFLGQTSAVRRLAVTFRDDWGSHS